MPKKIIKKYLPHPDKIKNHKHLRFLGDRIHDPNLWHLSRRSVPGAFAAGLFFALFPVPFWPVQMVWASIAAIYFRFNLPVAVVLVWISNPFTWVPLTLFCYKVGAIILGVELLDLPEEITKDWFMAQISILWKPLLLGSFVTSTTLALIGYFGIKGIWRISVGRSWAQRKQRRKKKKKS